MENNGSPKVLRNFLSRVWTRVVDIATLVGRARIGNLLSLGIFAVLFLLGLHLFNMFSLPFYPFTTRGKIYVDSPEVYTRERLVNDRYDQDYWLRNQLKALDASGIALVDEISKTDLQTGIDVSQTNGNGQKAQTYNNSEEKNSGQPQLTFDQTFHIVAGIRDKLRQQILENMLDDRHDLTGNSVYGLKFDTTVVPGSNTRQRAFVHVKLMPDDTFRNDKDSIKHIKAYVITSSNTEAGVEEKKLLEGYNKQKKLYHSWLKSIEKRLNSIDVSKDDTKNRVADILENVLGIPHQRFNELNPETTKAITPEPTIINDLKPVILPPPWSQFFTISKKELSDKSIMFEVHEYNETFLVFYNPEKPATMSICREIKPCNPDNTNRPEICDDKKCSDSNEIPVELIRIGQFENDLCGIYVDLSMPRRKKLLGSYAATLQYNFSSVNFDELQQIMNKENQITVKTGLFNFIKQLTHYDAYSYAMFPKNEMVGILDEMSVNFNVKMPSSGFLGTGKHSQTSKTASVLVGYGDGGRKDPYCEEKNDSSSEDYCSPDKKRDDSVVFGWIISPRDSMEPMQKTQLALVSVPAWTDTLTMKILVGWLDDEGNPESPREEFTRTISVPPNFEAFDAIFREDAWVTQGPRIMNETMKEEIYVMSGQQARILISGSRLWRSAMVTLGGQLANRIRVMPNMEGIIAEFDKIDLPYAAYDPPGKEVKCEKVELLMARAVKLRVWTSEGVTDSKQVCVLFNPKKLEEKEKKDESPADTLMNLGPVGLRVWTSKEATEKEKDVYIFFNKDVKKKDKQPVK